MSDTNTVMGAGASPPRSGRGRPGSQFEAHASPAFAPLAIWTGGSFALLVLTTMGPKLWATQSAENAVIAVEIVAVGQAVLAAILWPIWTRSVATALGVLLSSPVWLLLAGRIAASPLQPTGLIAAKLAAVLAGLAILRLATPRSATGFLWALVLTLALGGPVLRMLHQGG